MRRAWFSHRFQICTTFAALLCSACYPEAAPPALAEELRTELVHDVGDVDDLIIDLDFTPDGRIFYLLRSGRVDLIDPAKPEAPAVEALTLNVSTQTSAESGLLGLAVSPGFAEDRFVYIHYVPADRNGNPAPGRVERYTVSDGRLTDPFVLFDDLPYREDQLYHFGGALNFGPDGKLYLILGDTHIRSESQNPGSLIGTIMRFEPDGSVPGDNPTKGSFVYAYGVRNGFGLAWSPETGLLYENENGGSCDDELNLIEPGINLGWGIHEWDACPYPDHDSTVPLYQWTLPSSPVGMLFYTGDVIPEWKNDLMMCAFNRRELHHFTLSADGRTVDDVEIIRLPDFNEMGYTCRVALAQGPDGWLYFSTETAIHRMGR